MHNMVRSSLVGRILGCVVIGDEMTRVNSKHYYDFGVDSWWEFRVADEELKASTSCKMIPLHGRNDTAIYLDLSAALDKFITQEILSGGAQIRR